MNATTRSVIARRTAKKKQSPSQHELTVHDRRAYNRKFADLTRKIRILQNRVAALEQINDGVR